MNIADIPSRNIPAKPWAEGEKIPWHDPAFSERMLDMHLSQEHDWASRRLSLVEQHVDWIDDRFLAPGSRILDLGCGPGLYTHRLARKGHECVGVDISPASIAHAQQQASAEGLPEVYELADIRQVDFGTGFDLVMMLFGEFNVFRSADARGILRKAHAALGHGGHLLVECHTFEEVERQGEAPPVWRAGQTGLFADYSHLWLEEHFWHSDVAAATTRYMIVDARDGRVTPYASTMQAYTDEQYERLFAEVGFGDVRRLPHMGESEPAFAGKLQVFTGCRAPQPAP